MKMFYILFYIFILKLLLFLLKREKNNIYNIKIAYINIIINY